MLKVGVTGNIGSGKSLVCAVFASLGVPIFNADLEARKLMETNPELRKSILNLLGPDSYQGGQLNRPYIASRIFRDKELLNSVNELVHPLVQQEARQWFNSLPKEVPYALQEAALLIESGSYKLLDHLILITAPQKIRLTRVERRDQSSSTMILERMNAQMNEDKKIILANSIIVNDGSILLLPQIQKIHEKLSQIAANS